MFLDYVQQFQYCDSASTNTGEYLLWQIKYNHKLTGPLLSQVNRVSDQNFNVVAAFLLGKFNVASFTVPVDRFPPVFPSRKRPKKNIHKHFFACASSLH